MSRLLHSDGFWAAVIGIVYFGTIILVLTGTVQWLFWPMVAMMFGPIIFICVWYSIKHIRNTWLNDR